MNHVSAFPARACSGSLLLVLLLASATVTAQTTQPWGGTKSGSLPGPKIEFDNEKYEFGTIEQGAVADHTFLYTNTGTKPLIVTEAKSSCGCTVPSFSKDPIAPGATGTIQVVFNSRGRKGKQQKSVTVKSNDPNRPVVQLTVVGDVSTPDSGEIQIQPMRLDFGLVKLNDFIELEVNLRNVGKKPLTILGVTGAPAELSAFLEGAPTIPVGGTGKIIVTLRPNERTKGGYYERSVNVRSDDPMKPTMRVPCVAYVHAGRGPRLLTVAGEIDVGAVDQAGQKLLSIPLMNPGDEPLKIDRVQVAGTALAVEQAEGMTIPPRESGVLTVNASQALHKGTFRDRILIYANDERLNPNAPSQSLTIFGHVTVDTWQKAPGAGVVPGGGGQDDRAKANVGEKR